MNAVNAAAHRALANADAVLAQKGRSFHWARRLLGTRHADRATRLYGFCRRIDDIADESSSPVVARAALAAIGVAIAGGKASDSEPVVADMLALMVECSIAPAIVLELLHGVDSDLDPVRFVDEAELLRYCYRVAGTVGLMMCKVLDVDNPQALHHAIDLGIGMQLTNICRDVCEDAAIDRRYVPATLIGVLAPRLLVDPGPALQPKLRSAVIALLACADRYYRSGEQGLVYLPLRARAGMLVAGRVYRAIGTQLRRADYACWQGRAVVPTRTKAGLTVLAVLTLASHVEYWHPSLRHDQTLHLLLQGLPYVD
ncbi:MAG: phytoene synthase [Burkholderiaceae bacterium]|jgi:phytoene synthase